MSFIIFRAATVRYLVHIRFLLRLGWLLRLTIQHCEKKYICISTCYFKKISFAVTALVVFYEVWHMSQSIFKHSSISYVHSLI